MQLLVAFATLVVFATESYLPSAVRQMGSVGPFLKMTWRVQASVVLLIPISLLESRRVGTQWLAPLMAHPRDAASILGSCAITGAAWVGAFGLFSLSLSTTSLAHATLCAVAMPPVYLAAWTVLVRGVRLSILEVCGVCVAVGGITIAVSDSGSDGGSASLAGDGFGLCSAACGAAFALSIESVRAKASMPLFAFQTAWMMCALPLTLILPLLTSEVSPYPAHGLFDWLLLGSHWPQVLFLALGMGVASQACMTVAAQEAGSLVLGLIWCLSPIGAGVVGWMLGEAKTPGAPTIAGGAGVTLGLALVLIGGDVRQRRAAVEIDTWAEEEYHQI